MNILHSAQRGRLGDDSAFPPDAAYVFDTVQDIRDFILITHGLPTRDSRTQFYRMLDEILFFGQHVAMGLLDIPDSITLAILQQHRSDVIDRTSGAKLMNSRPLVDASIYVFLAAMIQTPQQGFAAPDPLVQDVVAELQGLADGILAGQKLLGSPMATDTAASGKIESTSSAQLQRPGPGILQAAGGEAVLERSTTVMRDTSILITIGCGDEFIAYHDYSLPNETSTRKIKIKHPLTSNDLSARQSGFLRELHRAMGAPLTRSPIDGGDIRFHAIITSMMAIENELNERHQLITTFTAAQVFPAKPLMQSGLSYPPTSEATLGWADRMLGQQPHAGRNVTRAPSQYAWPPSRWYSRDSSQPSHGRTLSSSSDPPGVLPTSGEIQRAAGSLHRMPSTADLKMQAARGGRAGPTSSGTKPGSFVSQTTPSTMYDKPVARAPYLAGLMGSNVPATRMSSTSAGPDAWLNTPKDIQIIGTGVVFSEYIPKYNESQKVEFAHPVSLEDLGSAAAEGTVRFWYLILRSLNEQVSKAELQDPATAARYAARRQSLHALASWLESEASVREELAEDAVASRDQQYEGKGKHRDVYDRPWAVPARSALRARGCMTSSRSVSFRPDEVTRQPAQFFQQPPHVGRCTSSYMRGHLSTYGSENPVPDSTATVTDASDRSSRTAQMMDNSDTADKAVRQTRADGLAAPEATPATPGVFAETAAEDLANNQSDREWISNLRAAAGGPIDKGSSNVFAGSADDANGEDDSSTGSTKLEGGSVRTPTPTPDSVLAEDQQGKDHAG